MERVGAGKTYSCVKYLGNLYKKQITEIQEKEWNRMDLFNGSIKIKNKFIWLNRTDTEIKGKRANIFALNGWVSQGSQNEIQVPIEIKLKDDNSGKKINYFLTVGKYEAINNSSKIRGGENYNEYTYFVWDEFLDEMDKYVSSEMEKVKSILTTVMRAKKGTKWIFMANAVRKDNFVFREFKFNPDWLQKGQQMYYPERKWLFIYLGVSGGLEKEYEKSDLITVLGEDDKYLQYRLMGDFVKDENSLVERTLDNNDILKPRYNVVYLSMLIGVYSYKGGLYFSGDKAVKGGKIYPLSREDATTIGRQFINVDNFANQWLRLFRTKQIYFDSGMVEEAIIAFVAKSADFQLKTPK